MPNSMTRGGSLTYHLPALRNSSALVSTIRELGGSDTVEALRPVAPIFQTPQPFSLQAPLPAVERGSRQLQDLDRFAAGEALVPQSLPGLQPAQPVMRFGAQLDGSVSGDIVACPGRTVQGMPWVVQLSALGPPRLSVNSRMAPISFPSYCLTRI